MRGYRPLLAAACLALAPCWLSAEQYSFEQLGRRQNLGSLSIRALAKTGGLLWIGSTRGLFSFDGNRFQQHTHAQGMPLDAIGCLHATSGGDLYLAGLEGFARFHQGRFTQIQLPTSNGRPLHILSSKCMATLPDGRILLAASSGVFAGKGDSFTLLAKSENHQLTGISVSGKGKVLVTTDKGLLALRSQGASNHLVPDGEGLPEVRFSSPVVDRAGRTWLRARDRLYVRETDSSLFREVAIPISPFGEEAGIDQDREGNLWVPTFAGLYSLASPTVHKLYTMQHGLPTDDVTVFFQTGDGVTWLGTGTHGLVRWGGAPGWKSWTQRDGLSNDTVMSFAVDAGNRLWVGTQAGLNRMTPQGGFEVLDRSKGLAHEEVRALLSTPDGAIWAGSNEGGLTRFGPGGFASRYGPTHGLANTRVVSLTAEPDGSLWVCTRSGLYVGAWDQPGNPSFVRFPVPPLDQAGPIYKVLRSYDGAFWVANTSGLARFHEGRWRRYGKADGLTIDGVVFLVERTPNELWAGYAGTFGAGRLIFDAAGNLVAAHNYSGGKGLLTDDISFLGLDSRSRIWIGTDEGASVWDNGAWRHVSAVDGLAWNNTVLGGFLAHPDGRILIGTSSGFTAIPAGAALPEPSDAVIVGATSSGTVLPVGPGDSVPLPARNLTLHFADTNLHPAALFRYRILPGGGSHGEANWFTAPDRLVQIHGLEPGQHTVEVQSGNAGGQWSKQPAVIRFTVSPFWHEMVEFRLVLAVLFVGGAVGMWRRRVRALGRRNEELEAAVTQRTAELRRQGEQIEEQSAEIRELLDRAQESNRLKSEFLAAMSHEIRTPMNGVIGMTALALETPLNADQRDLIQTAHLSAQNLKHILNDILDFSKIEAGKLDIECVNFSTISVVEQSVHPFLLEIRSKGLRLEIGVDSALPPSLGGDPTRLRQVLSNLVSNACKFTASGTIRVTAALLPAGPSPDKVHLQFSVTDTGIGIAPEHMAVIFEPFRQADGSTTRRYGGTGLGLAICARLVELMGGRIWVKSAPGGGSTFSFTVACTPVSATPPVDAGPQSATASRPDPLLILVAEDNLTSQALLRRLLQMSGHTVHAVSNGVQALDALESEPFDLVLMDVQMPEMDGLAAVAALRQREAATGQRTPVLMISANAMAGDAERGIAAGADGYLTKPIAAADLHRAIAELMTKARPAPETAAGS